MGKQGKPRKAVLTLELAFVLPILLLVVLAVVQLSTYLLATQAIQAAALVGAREATLPGATTASVNSAVRQTLSGWRFKDDVSDGNIIVKPDHWQNARSGQHVAVSVSVDAKKAACNTLAYLPGFGWTNEKIRGQYIMRKE